MPNGFFLPLNPLRPLLFVLFFLTIGLSSLLLTFCCIEFVVPSFKQPIDAVLDPRHRRRWRPSGDFARRHFPVRPLRRQMEEPLPLGLSAWWFTRRCWGLYWAPQVVLRSEGWGLVRAWILSIRWRRRRGWGGREGGMGRRWCKYYEDDDDCGAWWRHGGDVLIATSVHGCHGRCFNASPEAKIITNNNPSIY